MPSQKRKTKKTTMINSRKSWLKKVLWEELQTLRNQRSERPRGQSQRRLSSTQAASGPAAGTTALLRGLAWKREGREERQRLPSRWPWATTSPTGHIKKREVAPETTKAAAISAGSLSADVLPPHTNYQQKRVRPSLTTRPALKHKDSLRKTGTQMVCSCGENNI